MLVEIFSCKFKIRLNRLNVRYAVFHFVTPKILKQKKALETVLPESSAFAVKHIIA